MALRHTQPPAWVSTPYAGLGLDFDFENGRYWQKGPPIWDPNLVLACSRASTGYADAASGVWSSFASNVPRRTDKGLLSSGGRTNGIRNNSMQGVTNGVVGSGGVLPTNWSIGGSIAGLALTTTIVGTGTEDGVDYIEIRISGTPSSSSGGPAWFNVENNTQIVAVNGQSWAASLFCTLVAGSLTNLAGGLFYRTRFNNSGGSILTSSNLQFSPTSGALGLSRRNLTVTASDAATAFITSELLISVTSGAAIDATFRIGWPQLELVGAGGVASSPIRTTSAAVTRASDVLAGRALPSLGSAMTLLFKGTPFSTTAYANQGALSINVADGTNNNRVVLYRETTTGAARCLAIVAGVAQGAPASAGTWAQSTSRKLVGALAANDCAASFNGGAVVTSSSNSMPSGLNAVNPGVTGGAFGSSWEGYIERIAIWPGVRLSNADLQRLSA